jgi:hypothetical protein
MWPNFIVGMACELTDAALQRFMESASQCPFLAYQVFCFSYLCPKAQVRHLGKNQKIPDIL